MASYDVRGGRYLSGRERDASACIRRLQAFALAPLAVHIRRHQAFALAPDPPSHPPSPTPRGVRRCQHAEEARGGGAAHGAQHGGGEGRRAVHARRRLEPATDILLASS